MTTSAGGRRSNTTTHGGKTLGMLAPVGEPDGLEDQIRVATEAKDWPRAATLALEGYGPEVLGFLVTLTRSAVDASEAFSIFSEGVWRGLPKFRWEASFRDGAADGARY